MLSNTCNPLPEVTLSSIRCQDWLRTALGGVALVVVVVALYFIVGTFSFINFDDNIYITENPNVLGGLTLENIRWAFTTSHGGHWHPLTWISHMLDCELFGLSSRAHHYGNVILHTANVVLLYLLLVRSTGMFTLSLAVAAIFGVHPMRIESVAWVTERKDVLSFFFLFLVFHSYISFIRNRSKFYYAAALTMFSLGLLAKPTIVTAPVLLLLFDYWPLARLVSGRTVYRAILEKIPFFLPALIVSLCTLFAQKADGGLKSLEAYPLGARVSNALLSYLIYFGKLFWPGELGIFYPFEIFSPSIGVAAGSVVIAMTLLIATVHRKAPALLFGWLWFLVALLPMAGFIQVGGQAYADRWSYLPHIGLLIAIVWLVERVRYRLLVVAILALWAVVLTVATWQQLPHWQDSITLFRQTLRASPRNFMAHTNLGSALDAAGKLEEAKYHYQLAVELRPNYPVALNNLGSVEARQGELHSAERRFQRAIEIQPSFGLARYNFGLTLASRGADLQALEQWLEVRRTTPQFSQAVSSISHVVNRQRDGSCIAAVGERSVNLLIAQTIRKQLSTNTVLVAEDLRRRILVGLSCY